MAHLTTGQLRQFEQRLRDRQRVLIDEVKAQRERTAAGPNEAPTGVVGDAGDESVSRMLIDLGIEEAGRDLDELRDIEAALQRVADGNYGVCETCSGEIDYRRLEAQPTAARCITCQAQHEKTYAHKNTPTL